MIYGPGAKTARMSALRDLLAGGALELLAAAGPVLVRIPLAKPCGTVKDDVLTLFLPPAGAMCAGTGKAVSARVVTASGAVEVDELSVGEEGTTPAPDIALSLAELKPGIVVSIPSLTLQHG